ncbi:hypothetical protein MLD38_007325 [Melastoma candidum]|uniref:Uncharacterized protein n=1 Tax=Melastoma candidum TaxID=119954 RepID=A0ACB9RTS3_9MYRT|nr:hypothetical protein MLD38_007325 [Melastoma candidum]
MVVLDTASPFDKYVDALRSIEEVTRDADSVQERVLDEILCRNSDAEYLRQFSLGGARDRRTFKSKVPVVNYEDLQPYIQRIANGDRSDILSSRPITEFLTSSGTSGGERKLMPCNEDDWDRRDLIFSLVMPIINTYIPGVDKGKGLYFYFVKAETKTPGGLLAHPVLTGYVKSSHFSSRWIDDAHISPLEAILCPDTAQSMYVQMLCGLIMRDQVNRIGAIFASGLIRAIRFLQLNWKALVYDIRSGTLGPKITDASIRGCMTRILRPDPELAEDITSECSDEKWAGIIRRIWPNVKYLEVIVTGAMAQYIPTLDYYGGGLPLVSMIYASSECFFGPNLKPISDPSEVSYTILPNMGYFEFLPCEAAAPSLPVDMVDVEIGKEYELVVTTYTGLCRYRIGDILRVTGFHNLTPQFQFVRRKNVLLSIDSDKTDEAELQTAVENASKLLSGYEYGIVDYTSYADTKTVPGHYVIYWELLAQGSATNAVPKEVLDHCCLVMEESFNSVYRQGRVAENSIGPLEIRVVNKGTFEEVMDYVVSRGASINQYKLPRCVNFTPIVDILDSRVATRHFSPRVPHWNTERRA